MSLKREWPVLQWHCFKYGKGKFKTHNSCAKKRQKQRYEESNTKIHKCQFRLRTVQPSPTEEWCSTLRGTSSPLSISSRCFHHHHCIALHCLQMIFVFVFVLKNKPVSSQLLDSMSYSKLNVFHWHVTDSQVINTDTGKKGERGPYGSCQIGPRTFGPIEPTIKHLCNLNDHKRT